jgi:hypothetical protein
MDHFGQCRLVQQVTPYLTTPKLQLVSLTVTGMTAAKFKPVIFPMHGFSLSNCKNISIQMILDDFCLRPA